MFFTSHPSNGRLAILKILNILEKANYKLSDVEFTLPELNTDTVPVRNTKIEILFLIGKNYYGRKMVQYNRIHISDIPTITVVRGTATTYFELIPVINSTFNLKISEEDLIDGALPDIVSEEVTVTLPISEDSYLFYDSTKINTPGEPVAYNLQRPSDVFNSNYCVGFNKYGNFTTIEGDEYSVLLQNNSASCGYVTLETELFLEKPSNLSLLTNTESSEFTVGVLNHTEDVTITLTLPSNVTSNKNSFTLTASNPTNTFKLQSSASGSFNISISNNRSLNNPEVITILVTAPIIQQLIVTQPVSLSTYVNQPTGDFSVRLVNGQQPVVIDLSLTSGLVSSKETFTLTPNTNQDTFTLSSSEIGNYTVSFANNAGITTPAPINLVVKKQPELELSAPDGPHYRNVQTDFFTVTLKDGEKPVLISPIAPGGVVVPTSLVVRPSAPDNFFRVTYAQAGTKNVSIINNGGITNPLPEPILIENNTYVSLTPPIATISKYENSLDFVVYINDPVEDVDVVIDTNISQLIPGGTFTLNEQNPTYSFKVREDVLDIGYVELTSTSELEMPDRYEFLVRTPQANPVLSIEKPIGDIYVGESSGIFRIKLNDPNGPVNITMGTNIRESTRIFFQLSELNFIEEFTVKNPTPGTFVIELRNNAGLVDIPTFSVLVLPDPTVLTMTPPPETTFPLNVFSGDFTVSADVVRRPFIVTPTPSANLVFVPESIAFTPTETSRTFKVKSTTEGNKTISLTNNNYLQNPASIGITIPIYVPQSLSLTKPTTTITVGASSGLFTIRLNDAESPVAVNVTGSAGLTISDTLINLDVGSNTGTFSIIANEVGTYTVTISNNASLANPTVTTVIFTEAVIPKIVTFGTNNTRELYVNEDSEPYEISVTNLTGPVTVTPSGQNGFSSTPATFSINPTQPSGIFTFKGSIARKNNITLNISTLPSTPGPAIFIIDTDLNYDDTVLLIKPRRYPNADTIADESWTTKTITNVNTTQVVDGGLFDRVISFDGENNFLRGAHSPDFNLFGSDFTIEGRVAYAVKVDSTQTLIDFRGQDNSSGSFVLRFNTVNRRIGLYRPFYNETIIESNTNAIPSQNNDFEFSFVCLNNTIKIYVNGNSVATSASSVPHTSTTGILIGKGVEGNGFFKGLISYLRISKVGRYIANYTPTTLPLAAKGTKTISLTSPVINQVYVGTQSKNFTVTIKNITETIVITPTGPAGSTFVPTTLTLDGNNKSGTFTVAFSSTGSKSISVTNNLALPNPLAKTLNIINASTFTITEPSSLDVLTGAYSQNFSIVATNYIGDDFVVTPTGPAGLEFLPTTVTIGQNTTTGSFKVRSLVEGDFVIAFNNNGGFGNPPDTVISFVGSTTIIRTTPDPAKKPYTFSSDPITLRAVNPLADFTLSPYFDALFDDTYKANVVLYVDFQNQNLAKALIDRSASNHVITPTNCTIETLEPIYGRGSLSLDGTGDYLTITDNLNDFNFGTGDFTVEIDFKTTIANKVILDFNSNTDTGTGWYVSIGSDGLARWRSNNGGIIIASSIPVISGTAVRLMICRTNGYTRMFIDNSVVGGVTDTRNYTTGTNNKFGIGGRVTDRVTNFDYNGLIGRIRITKGVGRYQTINNPLAIVYPVITPIITTLGLSKNEESFTVTSSTFRKYSIGFDNSLSLPVESVPVEFTDIPSIVFTGPSGTASNIGENSSSFTITINNIAYATIVTINITPSLTLNIDPSVRESAFEMRLDSNTSTGTFTVSSNSPGFFSISLVNDSGITNPPSINHSFNDPSQIPLFIADDNYNLNMVEGITGSYDLNLFQTIVN